MAEGVINLTTGLDNAERVRVASLVSGAASSRGDRPQLLRGNRA
jgi:hypothetical protein